MATEGLAMAGLKIEEYVKLIKMQGEVQRAHVVWEQICQIVDNSLKSDEKRARDLARALAKIQQMVNDELRGNAT
jgi:hypothetical protein